MTKKGAAVDPLSTLSDCRLMNLKTGRSAFGKILKLHLGGVSIFTNFELKSGEFLRVTFFDEVSCNVITVFVRVEGRMFRIREWFRYFQHRRVRNASRFPGTSKPIEYFGRMCNLKRLPEEYLALVKRMEQSAEDRHDHKVQPLEIFASNKIVFKIAETAAEKEAAWRLAYLEAVRRTGAPHSDKQLLISNHLLLPSTVTVIGTRAGEVAMTLTCTGDTAFGLPLEEAHAALIANLRSESVGLVEFGLFGVSDEALGRFGLFGAVRRASALKELFKFAVRHATLVRGATRAVAASGIFEKDILKRFGFSEVRFDARRPWTALQNPVVMDLKKAESGFAGGAIDPRRISVSNTYTMRDLYYLFVEQSNLAARLTRDQRQLLSCIHPHLSDWFSALPTLLLYS